MKKKIVFTEAVHPLANEIIQARSDVELIVAPDTTPETLRRLIEDADGVGVRLAQLPADILAPAKRLQVVSRHGVGCDNVDVKHLSERGIPMAIAAGSNAVSVAEHTLMLMLASIRRLRQQDAAMRSGNFSERGRLFGNELKGRHALVIGFGRTGREVAPLCKAFGMRVTVADIKPDLDAAAAMGCEFTEDFNTVIADADVVTLHVPLTSQTSNMLSADVMNRMKPGSIVVNCARGGVLDETALLDCLENGPVVAAGVDVFAVEPTPVDTPLFARDDVVVTPHTAGTSHTAVLNMATMMAQNILDQFDGNLLPQNILNGDDLNTRSTSN